MSRSHDLTGKMFGRWNVLERVENTSGGSSQWLCRCKCGTERIVKGKRLTRGDTVSCGCLRSERNSTKRIRDMRPGQKFGKWEVVGFDAVKGGKAHWLCRCSCGTMRSVIGSNLRRGLSLGCGKCGA